jgi:PBP1b-binding outer membrane lipoprotein LpoB
MKTAISFAVWCLLLAGCSSGPKTCAELSKQVDSTSEFVQRHIQEELNKLRRAGPAENRSPYIEEMKSNAIYGAESLEKRSGEIVSCTCSEQERIDLKARIDHNIKTFKAAAVLADSM